MGKLKVQPKLLRAIETKRITPLGGKQVSVDVRIIAATSADLRGLIKSGLFRKELFYRLRVVEINLPPLRERREDIPLLIEHFLDIYQQKYQRSIVLSDDAKALLMNYSWPGNVRELQNLLQSAIIMADKDVLTVSDFKPDLNTELPSDTGEILPLKSALENFDAYNHSGGPITYTWEFNHEVFVGVNNGPWNWLASATITNQITVQNLEWKSEANLENVDNNRQCFIDFDAANDYKLSAYTFFLNLISFYGKITSSEVFNHSLNRFLSFVIKSGEWRV